MADTLNLATANRGELIAYLKGTETTFDESLPDHKLRELAVRTQDDLADIGEDRKTEEEAQEASKEERAQLREVGKQAAQQMVVAGLIGQEAEREAAVDLSSLEVQPESGNAKSIHDIISEQTESEEDGNKTPEQLMATERARQLDIQRKLIAVAAADKQIGVYHRKAIEKLGAKLTDVCFFLKTGMQLSSFHTKYTRIPGVRLRRETPYRALDIELPIFRRKRGMFGEKAYGMMEQEQKVADRASKTTRRKEAKRRV